MKERRKTRRLTIGDVAIGGGAPVVIQSMNNTKTADVEGTLAQLNDLKRAGCQIGRLAVPDGEAAAALKEIVPRSPLPLVADIHFDYRLALQSVANGIDALRINPGNIGSEEKVKAVIAAARERDIPIRIGINGGSLEKDLLAKYGNTAEAIVESALREIAVFEKYGFDKV